MSRRNIDRMIHPNVPGKKASLRSRYQMAAPWSLRYLSRALSSSGVVFIRLGTKLHRPGVALARVCFKITFCTDRILKSRCSEETKRLAVCTSRCTGMPSVPPLLAHQDQVAFAAPQAAQIFAKKRSELKNRLVVLL